jgi:hypothetical protein
LLSPPINTSRNIVVRTCELHVNRRPEHALPLLFGSSPARDKPLRSPSHHHLAAGMMMWYHRAGREQRKADLKKRLSIDTITTYVVVGKGRQREQCRDQADECMHLCVCTQHTSS